jgi:lambda family phage portal protein
MGIEKDSIGRRVAYWMFKSHPGESFFVDDGSTERVRVPADEIIHTFRQERAGQDRGRPWLSSVIVKLHDIDECVDAELVRRKTTAMFGGFVRKPGAGFDENPETDGHILGTYDGTDAADASKVIDFQPGTFPYLPEGWDIVFAEPKDVTGNYIAWIEQQLRDVARGIGITFEQLTGNLKGTSYSSIRAGLVEFRRLAEMYQYQILIHMFCRPFIKAWMDQAVLSGALDISDYLTNWRAYNVVEWRPAGWAWVDPLKDIKGDVMAVRSGFKSRSQIINEYGYDPETIDAEMMEDNTRADEMGLILDSDPRKTTLSGMYQIDTTGGEDAE